jgi:hypothetical protein
LKRDNVKVIQTEREGGREGRRGREGGKERDSGKIRENHCGEGIR